MQKRQDLLKVLAFLHFRDFSYSPICLFLCSEELSAYRDVFQDPYKDPAYDEDSCAD